MYLDMKKGMVMMQLKSIPLRERKKARTRLAILEAVIRQLREKPLGEIPVEDIVEEAGVSRGTFFQYFPQKSDLLVFFGLLWNLETLWRVTAAPNALPGAGAIDAMFMKLGEQVEDHPRLWAEVIAVRAYQPEKFSSMGEMDHFQVTPAERLMHFPELPGIEKVPEGNFRTFFRMNLVAAMDGGELPENTNLQAAITGLACIFYGVPLMSFDKTPMQCRGVYRQQLDLFWKGLGRR